jgi:hypothetical protein
METAEGGSVTITFRCGTWLAKQRLEAMLKPLGMKPKDLIAAHGHEH